jgi:pre-mRNA cleavage complex 2 protein Pcf11
MRAEFSQTPHDGGVQSRLKALLDLQGVVQHTNLPPDQLELIKNKVTELAAVTLRASLAHSSATSTPIPAPVAAPSLALPVHPPSASVTPSPMPAAQPAAPVTLDSLLGQGAMAALLNMQSANSHQNTTPKPPFAGVPIRSPQMNHNEPPKAAVAPPSMAAAPASNASSLLDRLRAAGMLPPATPPNVPNLSQPPVAPPPPPSMFPSGLPASIASLLAAHKQDSGRSSADSLGGSVGFDLALKQQ